MVISGDLPAIVKVSHAHAGMGKAIIKDQQGWRDLSTVLSLVSTYLLTHSPLYLLYQYAIA